LRQAVEAGDTAALDRFWREMSEQGTPLDVAYSEFSGGHNPMNWRGTLANGVLALFGQGEGLPPTIR